jgi:uncharacterized protein (TIGR00251 family)
MAWFEWREDALQLTLQVQPRARRDGVDGLHGDALRVRVQAPPVDDQANRAVTDLLATEFGCARNAVELVRGATGRRKLVRLRTPVRLPDWFCALGGRDHP